MYPFENMCAAHEDRQHSNNSLCFYIYASFKQKNAVTPAERTKVTPAWKNDPGTDSEVELE